MLIDWFTVGAQLLNFLVLAWLLKRFLYRPILHAIDAREKQVAAELAEAGAKRRAAEKDRDDFQNKNRAFDTERAALLAKAQAEAETERGRLLEAVRKEGDDLRGRQAGALLAAGASLTGTVVRLAQAEVFAIARRALGDLAAVSLEERMGEVFTRRLHGLDENLKVTLGAALRTGAEPAAVVSTFELPADQRAQIQNALNETFSAEIRVRFETAPDAVCGIELTAGGLKVAWSIGDYLGELQRRAEALIAVPAAA